MGSTLGEVLAWSMSVLGGAAIVQGAYQAITCRALFKFQRSWLDRERRVDGIGVFLFGAGFAVQGLVLLLTGGSPTGLSYVIPFAVSGVGFFFSTAAFMAGQSRSESKS